MSVNVKMLPKVNAVKYASIRPDIRSGDVLLCSGNAWFSKLIQHATDSIWSHVAFIMRVAEIDRVMVLESVEPIGVRTVPLSKYLTDYDSKGNPYDGSLVLMRHDKFESVAFPNKLKKLGQFAVELFGYPYDKEEIAKIAARIASSKIPFTKQEKKELEHDREYICSEYVWECYNSVGIEIDYDPRGFVAPADFARAKDMKQVCVLKKA